MSARAKVPEVERLKDADYKTDRKAEQFDGAKMLLRDREHERFKLLNGIVRNFAADDAADIKFADRGGQAFARSVCNSQG